MNTIGILIIAALLVAFGCFIAISAQLVKDMGVKCKALSALLTVCLTLTPVAGVLFL